MEADSLAIVPFKKHLKSTLTLPGSKSITNRTLIIGALSNGTLSLEGALFSRDTLLMLEALKTLGFEIRENKSTATIQIHGLSGNIPNQKASLNVGNAGTAARFLTALLALNSAGEYELDGDPQMHERPMKGLLDALRALDAADFVFHKKEDHFPFKMYTKGILSPRAMVDASASSQILSALLLTLPASDCIEDIHLTCSDVRPAYVSVTEAIKRDFGIQTKQDSTKTFRIKNEAYRNPSDGIYTIEPDLSAASYFLALTVLHGGKLDIKNIPKNPIQGDAAFAKVLKAHNLEIESMGKNWRVSRSNSLTVVQSEQVLDFKLFSDTFITYAAIAPIISKNVLITGIGHTRFQETDRIAAMAKELKKLGQEVHEQSSSLQIISDIKALKAVALAARAEGKTIEIDTYEDHRIAMAFGILGTYDLLEDGSAWLSIKDPNCCGKTFPKFFTTLKELKDASES